MIELGRFIEVTIDYSKFKKDEQLRKLVDVCPVTIFTDRGGRVIVDPENEDECTLCNLCLENSPKGAVKVRKRY